MAHFDALNPPGRCQLKCESHHASKCHANFQPLFGTDHHGLEIIKRQVVRHVTESLTYSTTSSVLSRTPSHLVSTIETWLSTSEPVS